MGSATSARAHLHQITQMEHVGGTPQGLWKEIYVNDELAKALTAPGAGVSVVMDAVKVLLAYPVNRSLTMRASEQRLRRPGRDAGTVGRNLGLALAQDDLLCLLSERTRGGRAGIRQLRVARRL
jgi:hypothetical protein